MLLTPTISSCASKAFRQPPTPRATTCSLPDFHARFHPPPEQARAFRASFFLTLRKPSQVSLQIRPAARGSAATWASSHSAARLLAAPKSLGQKEGQGRSLAQENGYP